MKAKISTYLCTDEIKTLTPGEYDWLADTLRKFNGMPSLVELWQIMDIIWVELGCDNDSTGAQIKEFYDHPVWILNSIFTEHDPESKQIRLKLADYISKLAPLRVLDFGGGGGALAKAIAHADQKVQIDVLEPYPRQLYIEQLARYSNIRYVSKPQGMYDLIVSTDAFEHIPDPLSSLFKLLSCLKTSGFLLTAQGFIPSIKCHLKDSLHLHHSWEPCLNALGLPTKDHVLYGYCFGSPKKLDIVSARRIETISRFAWVVTKYMPARLTRPTFSLLHSFLSR